MYTCVSLTWLEEKSRGTEHYELRRRDDEGENDKEDTRRRKIAESWMEAKVCEARKLGAVFCFVAF